ncbi:MAG TPA: PrsW family glutamic-type intramembrane protease [Candidatus Paceibacterota bacterium]|nr:PrsW family glutamic-type intramembrane protease [Candidatus Paceibacterota bacterium]
MVFDGNFKTIIVALLGGLIPALLWLWFWLKEDKERPEPRGLIITTFLIGMASVMLVLPLEEFARKFISDGPLLTIAWSAIEEVVKLFVVAIIAFRTAYVDEPVDFAIYMITGALGFAALENALFLMHPLQLNETTVSLLTGNLRFLGATLLHAVASGFIGIFMGLAFFAGKSKKSIYLVLGVLTAIVLHSLFNFFIIGNNGENFFAVFGFLWVISIISVLLFEKLRRMGDQSL